MSIVNNASPGSQIRIIYIIDEIINRNPGKYNTKEMVKICRPENISQSTDAMKRFKWELDFWLKHKLWREIRGKLHPKSEHPLNVRLNDIIWTSVHKDFKDIQLATTLLLVQCGNEIFNYRISKQNYHQKINNRLDSLSINTSMYQTLMDYLHLLGIVEKFNNNEYVIDITRLVSSLIKYHIEVNIILTIGQFIEKFEDKFPVIQTGSIASRVKSELGQIDDNSKVITPPLSQALDRLNNIHTIELEYQSDDQHSMNLLSPSSTNESVSRIRIN